MRTPLSQSGAHCHPRAACCPAEAESNPCRVGFDGVRRNAGHQMPPPPPPANTHVVWKTARSGAGDCLVIRGGGGQIGPTRISADPPTHPQTHPPTLRPTHPPSDPPAHPQTHPPTLRPTHPPSDPPTHPPAGYPGGGGHKAIFEKKSSWGVLPLCADLFCFTFCHGHSKAGKKH